eukprot:7537175-Pyramimonas_sp.AAC.1
MVPAGAHSGAGRAAFRGAGGGAEGGAHPLRGRQDVDGAYGPRAVQGRGGVEGMGSGSWSQGKRRQAA